MKVTFILMSLLIFVPPILDKMKRMKTARDYKEWRKYQDANKVK